MDSILPLLKATQDASVVVRKLSDKDRADLLFSLANKVIAHADRIVEENKKDLDVMDDADPKKDRLLLNEKRIEALAQSLRDVAALPDPTGEV
ncbi:MAG TPA: gamma-glutamyl-phosphate reductase, partial [Dyadobacter sp.]|nr:gamma-glutamyl-phosphate reductase [Dyadobacter sp.]